MYALYPNNRMLTHKDFLGLVIFGLAFASLGMAFQWQSSYDPKVLNPSSGLTLRWSFTLSEKEQQQARDFSLVIIEKESHIYSDKWQGLTVKIPFSGVQKDISRSSNIRLLRGNGAGIIIYNVTEQETTRYRCTFFSGFSVPKEMIMPNIRVINVRLVGSFPFDPSQGRVEIFHEGQWGLICYDGWDIRDANVVCRMLGYLGARYYSRSSCYGYCKIWLTNMQCQGNEPSITDCGRISWGAPYCRSGNRYAGVRCLTHPMTTPWPHHTTRRPYPTWRPYTANPSPVSTSWPYYTYPTWRPYTTYYPYTPNPSPGYNPVRLVGGISSSMGRVEIWHNGVWGTICDDGWDINDARVVCRMLGYPLAYKALGAAYFGRGSGQIWLDEVGCRGNEPTISRCRHLPWGRHDCGHHEDAGVMCTFSTWRPPITSYPTRWPTTSISFVRVRLVGNSSYDMGRVEVYYSGQWGTICDDGWDMRDAQVVCRMLGFRGAYRALGSAYFGSGRGRIWLDDVDCNGYERSISSCRSSPWGVHNCTHSQDAGVMCSSSSSIPPLGNVTVRLAGFGSSSLKGRVEVFYNGEWGTICDDNWDIRDAHVVCRMLGHSKATRAVGRAYFGRGWGRIWIDGIHCRGNESSITQCVHNGWGIHNCRHSEDAGVICEEAVPSSIHFITATIFARRGSSLYLLCSATGSPSPTVRWIHNNRTVAWGVSFVRYYVNTLTFYHSGAYECFASNMYGSASNTTFVYVLQRPMNTFILFNVSQGAAMIGEPVMITCKTEAYPAPTCEVYRHGNRLGNSRYIIPIVTSSDFGSYNCNCINSLGRGNGSGALTLYESPNIETIYPKTQNSSETGSFTIFCNATGNPLPKLYWYRFGDDETPVGHGNKLSISNSSMDDEGTYTCTADNGRNQVKENATVHLIYRVSRIIYPPQNITVQEDNDRARHLYCNVTGFPTPNVTWFKVSLNKLTPVDRGSVLTLFAKWDNSGIYQCIAKNGIGGAAKAKAFFQVLHKPYSTKLKTNRDNNVVIGNAPITIICTTIANPPASHFDIYREGKRVAISSSGLYVIRKARAEDQGTYNCFPRNTIGSGENATMELHVFGALSITSAPQNTTAVEGRRVTLHCNASSTLYKVPLPAIIRWQKVGEKDLHFPEGEWLVLEDVQPKDAGMYKCDARNGIALPDVARATLIVQYKPKKTKLTLSTGGFHVHANGSMSLVCHASSVPPASNFKFFFEGNKVGEFSHGVFNVSRVSSSNNGTYSCVPVNYLGEGPIASITIKFTSCGERTFESSPQTRIVGGDPSLHGGWPWQVQMGGLRYGIFFKHLCGASVVNKKWVVTAAHCVTQKRWSQGYIVARPEHVNITVGEYNLSRVDGTEQQIPVDKVIVHRQYNTTNTDYDIALLKLKRPMIFNSHVSPVCLPTSDFPPNTLCYVTGWGRTTMANYKSSIVLQEAMVPLMDRNRCKYLFRNLGTVTSRMRCNGYNGFPKSTCHGDSGGPLVCARNGRWFLMGITSWGARDCTDMRYPSVYADVLYFRDWILNTIKQNS